MSMALPDTAVGPGAFVETQLEAGKYSKIQDPTEEGFNLQEIEIAVLPEDRSFGVVEVALTRC